MIGEVDVMAALVENGVLLESGRGPIANVAELVAGEPVAGRWWGHPAGERIFAAVNLLADSPDVARLRLVGGKVTLVHRRLWPALARLAGGIAPAALAAVVQEHTPAGRHRTVTVPFDEWLPAEAREAGARMTAAEALAAFPPALRPGLAGGRPPAT
jgi:hypothetical protein